jgi:hypothetical protein
VPAPEPRRSLPKIAALIAAELRVSGKARRQITVGLKNLVTPLRGLVLLKKVDAFKEDVEYERQRLDKLRSKYYWMGPNLRPLDEAVANLERMQRVWASGLAAKQADPFIAVCIKSADHLIRMHADHKRSDKRLGWIAGLIYEAITGVRGKTFRRACEEYHKSR